MLNEGGKDRRSFQAHIGFIEILKTNVDYRSVLHTADIPKLEDVELIIGEQGLRAALKWREPDILRKHPEITSLFR